MLHLNEVRYYFQTSIEVWISNIWLTGHILIFIPRNFCGAIQLKSRKNGYQILPALASASRTLKTKDHEALILVGDPTSLSTSPDTADDLAADFCQLESRGGKVTVGFTGEDKYVPTEIGMWQKVGEFFKGKCSWWVEGVIWTSPYIAIHLIFWCTYRTYSFFLYFFLQRMSISIGHTNFWHCHGPRLLTYRLLIIIYFPPSSVN